MCFVSTRKFGDIPEVQQQKPKQKAFSTYQKEARIVEANHPIFRGIPSWLATQTATPSWLER